MDSPGAPARTARTAYLLLALTALFWAGNAILARGLHAQISPVTFAFWRWALASALLLPFAWRVLRADWPRLRADWPWVLLLAVLGVSVFNTVLYHAAHSTTATNIALVQTVMPATIVLLGALLFGERVSLPAVAGVIVSMLGAAVVVLRGDPSALLHWRLVAGDLWMLLAVVAYALYSVLLRRRPQVHPLSFLAASFVLGTLVLLPVYAWEAARSGPPAVTGGLLAGIAYVALFPSILAYLFWNRGVALIGASRAGFFICLIPVFAAVLAMLFLGERLHPYHLAGLGLILAGFWLFNRAY